MPPKYCAPSKFGRGNTCLSRNELQVIAADYNDTYNENQINLNLPKSKLYNTIRERLTSHCNDESCIIEQDFVRDEHRRSLEQSFRPKKPKAWYKNRRTWLNTFDILHVMKQYEHLHKSFAFLGVFPMDFQEQYSTGQCIGMSLCNFNIKEFITKKKDHFAFVLNLDYHNESGSHWVAVYCNLNPKKNNFGIYYYDSVANVPTKEVKAFSAKIADQVRQHFGDDIGKNFKTQYNVQQKQFKNTECGVFSMVFITQMLKYIDFNFVCQHMRKDDEMNEIRDVLYRPNKI